MENENLFENFDFIEEATPFSTVPLDFQDVSEVNISESKSEKSPYKIIGKVKGCMAPIGVYSRNHRIYENDHWPKALANSILQEKLKNRGLYGMPSHMQKMIDDEDFREGRISHIVACLEVREDNNGQPFLYGELDILDTPAGRILKAMYEGGAGIYVSTRAAGRLLPIPGDSVNKKVDSSSYFLGGIDCVLNPGFLQAKPAFEAVSVEPVKPQIHESASDIKEPLAVSQSSTVSTTPSVPITPVTTQQAPTTEVPEVDTEAGEETSESEVARLKSQVAKLTKIIEKVVDDVYEEPVEEGRKEGESTEDFKHRLHGELVRDIDNKADGARDKAIELSKEYDKVSAEKGKDSKEAIEARNKAVAASGEYLKQHSKLAKLDDIEPVANAYVDVKVDKNEALAEFVSLMAKTNISEEAFVEIVKKISGKDGE